MKETTPWKKQCPQCGKDQYYKRKYYLKQQTNSVCKSCARKGVPVSDEVKQRPSWRNKNILSRLRPHEWAFNKIKRKAKEHGYSVILSYEEFVMFTSISKCHYCDSPIVWMPFSKTHEYGHTGYNLDRKNNSLGYTKDNCVVCCPACNRIKGRDLSYELMLKIGDLIEQDRSTRGLPQLNSSPKLKDDNNPLGGPSQAEVLPNLIDGLEYLPIVHIFPSLLTVPRRTAAADTRHLLVHC